MESSKSVIFGATSALGQEVARNLLLTGTCKSFLLLARDSSSLEKVANDLVIRGARVDSLVIDLDDMGRHDELVGSVSDADSFWFFYGTLPEQSAVEKSWDATEASMRTNFLSCASLLLRISNMLELKNAKSTLVVVSSVAGDRGRKSNYIYGTAKGALSLFCQGLRNRFSGSNIHVLTVKPGFIDTPMTRNIEKKPTFLWVSPAVVAQHIVKAFRNKKNTVYIPWYWRYILFVVKAIPENIFKRMSL